MGFFIEQVKEEMVLRAVVGGVHVVFGYVEKAIIERQMWGQISYKESNACCWFMDFVFEHKGD